MERIALVMPGQGSQNVGMGKKLYSNFQTVRQLFEEASYSLGFDIKKLCFEGNFEELTKTENAQPAILTVSVAAFKVYEQEIGMEPLYLAGHSLGEYSALVCSGAIKFSDAVKLVNYRGKFMQEAAALGVGDMAAISDIENSTIKKECESISTSGNVVVISNYNSPNQTVISGHKQAVKEVCEKLKEKGARIIPLSVSAPFHCPLMQPAAEKLRRELEKYEFSDLKYKVISNVNALPYEGKSCIIDNLYEQMVKPVRWQQIVEYIYSQGIDAVIELGPSDTLKKLTVQSIPGVAAYSFDMKEDISRIKKQYDNEIKQIISSRNSKVKFISRCLAIAVCTPNSNWDNDEFSKGVVEPYKKIQKLRESIEKDGLEPDIKCMTEALHMLKSVFCTKRTPRDEQLERYNQLLNETSTEEIFGDLIKEMVC